MNDEESSDEKCRNFAWLFFVWIAFFFCALVFPGKGPLAFFQVFYPTLMYVLLVTIVLIQLARGYAWDSSWTEAISRSRNPYQYWGMLTLETCLCVWFLGRAYRAL